MDATAWTVIGASVTILIAIGVSFGSLRGEMNNLRKQVADQEQSLRARIDAQGAELREQMGQLRERMAHLEGLLEGLREAITQRAA